MDIFYSGGDVGIGTNNPAVKLEINGDLSATGFKVQGNKIYGQMDCSIAFAASPLFAAIATCPVGHQMFSGGGRCTFWSAGESGRLHESYPVSTNSWKADCETGGVEAYAICCKIIP